jgi:hypothetical protein
MAVFGQNHLHRGIDRRGVSTLGNFIAELAVAEGVESFHVVLFAAGGKINFNRSLTRRPPRSPGHCDSHAARRRVYGLAVAGDIGGRFLR